MIQVTFYPDVDKNQLGSGVMSEISWQRLHTYLEQAFAVRDGERLIGITVTETGIKANFDTI